MSQLVKMARELLTIDEDIPYRFAHNREKVTVDDFDLYTFEQTWGSTAGGFEGIGGQAITTQRTYVFVPRGSETSNCYVYFGSGFAYSAIYSDTFMADVAKGQMASVSQKGKYLKALQRED